MLFGHGRYHRDRHRFHQGQVRYEARAAEVLAAAVPPTLQEPGCLVYDLHQSLTDPTEFMFYERWSSDEALAAHAASTAPHRLALRDSFGQLLDGRPSVTRWRACL